MEIGNKIKQLRQKLGLTQEELANRAELSKGFISQVERDLTSPSISTLIDILECLGTNLKDFFNETSNEKIVYTPADIFATEYEDLGCKIEWLITNAQKNKLEPIMLHLSPGGQTYSEAPHEGEEFGHVLSGTIVLVIGTQSHRIKRGSSFYFRPLAPHYIKNAGKTTACVLWISTPPNF